MYGAASFNTKKPSHSSSFRPSAPSSGGPRTVGGSAAPSSHASDNHVMHTSYFGIDYLYLRRLLSTIAVFK